MPLESATYISELDPTNPVGSSDLVSSLDDHMRLVKATLKNTFPNIDGAVTATEDELNHLDGVTGTTGTGKLVLDDAPTIADLTVTDSITLPAASVADTALSDNIPRKNAENIWSARHQFGSHPTGTELQRSDDTGFLWLQGGNGNSSSNGARVALYGNSHSTNPGLCVVQSGTNGRLELSSAQAITLNGVDVTDYARQSQENTFLGTTQTVSAANANWLADNGTVLMKIQALDPGMRGQVGTQSNHELHFITNNTSRGSVRTDGSFHLPVVATSTSTTLAAGQVHAVTNNATLPNMAAGQWVGVINNSDSPITVAKSASDTMYWTALSSSVASVTIAARGKAAFFCADGTNVYASGNIIGSS